MAYQIHEDLAFPFDSFSDSRSSARSRMRRSIASLQDFRQKSSNSVVVAVALTVEMLFMVGPFLVRHRLIRCVGTCPLR
jgi:hypothetical protein